MFGSRPYSLKSLSEIERKSLDAALSIVASMDDANMSRQAKTALNHMKGFNQSFDKDDISIAVSALMAIVSAAQSGKLNVDIPQEVQSVFLTTAKSLADLV